MPRRRRYEHENRRAETRLARWFDPIDLPETLLPWYRGPIADALDTRLPAGLVRRDRQGTASVLAGVAIDLRMRLWGADPE